MTKKYFFAIAAALAESKPPRSGTSAAVQWELDCRRVALAIRDINQAFDAELFLKNCGVYA